MTDTTAALAATLKKLHGSGGGLTDGTMPDLARRLDLLTCIINTARNMVDELAETLSAAMEDDTQVITGVGVLVRKRRTSSAWLDDGARERMYDDTAHALVMKCATDPMTGEVHPPLANAVRAVWDIVQSSFSLGADPKTGFRKTLGLDASLYRTKYTTGHQVTITEETL